MPLVWADALAGDAGGVSINDAGSSGDVLGPGRCRYQQDDRRSEEWEAHP